MDAEVINKRYSFSEKIVKMEVTKMITYKELVSIMDDSFNYNLDFQSWDKKEFLQFCRDFLDGNTEYCVDKHFQKHYAKKCEEYLGEINER